MRDAAAPPHIVTGLRRARAACVLYAMSWLVPPILVMGVMLARRTVLSPHDVGSVFDVLVAVGVVTVLVGTTIFTWFIVAFARTTGHAGLPPAVACVLVLLCPGFALSFAVQHVETALLSVDREPATAGRIPRFATWAGPSLFFLTILCVLVSELFPRAQDSILSLVFTLSLVLYVVSRVVVAARLRQMIGDVLPRARHDVFRASNNQSVGA